MCEKFESQAEVRCLLEQCIGEMLVGLADWHIKEFGTPAVVTPCGCKSVLVKVGTVSRT